MELPIEDTKKMVGAAPPLGMLYIVTILRNEGTEVSMIDEAAQGFSMKGTVGWVKKENPDGGSRRYSYLVYIRSPQRNKGRNSEHPKVRAKVTS